MPNVAVDKATLVHIAVKNGKLLSVFPGRHGDTVAFSTRSGHQPTAERPHEVVWVGHDIPAGHSVAINAKDPTSTLLQQPNYALNKGNNFVESSLDVPQDQSGVWAYDVILLDPNGKVVYSIDPEIIIHPDP